MVLKSGEALSSLECGGQPGGQLGGGDSLEEELREALLRVTQCTGGPWGLVWRALQGRKEFDQKWGQWGTEGLCALGEGTACAET